MFAGLILTVCVRSCVRDIMIHRKLVENQLRGWTVRRIGEGVRRDDGGDGERVGGARGVVTGRRREAVRAL